MLINCINSFLKISFIFLLIVSCDNDDNNDSNIIVPPQNETYKDVQITNIDKYIGFPVFSKNSMYYGGNNVVYNSSDNSSTEYDFNKANNLFNENINLSISCISNDGIPYYNVTGIDKSLYFDEFGEPHILKENFKRFIAKDINNIGILCGLYSENYSISRSILFNTRNEKHLILSSEYNNKEIATIITNPTNNVFQVYSKVFKPTGEKSVCKWDISIDKDGNMKELSREIILDDAEFFGYNPLKKSFYGTKNNHFLQLKDKEDVQLYNGTDQSGLKNQLFYNEISLNNKNYGIGIETIFDKQYRETTLIDIQTKEVYPTIQQFIIDSLPISNEENILLSDIKQGFYSSSNIYGNSIILSDGFSKNIKIDFIK